MNHSIQVIIEHDKDGYFAYAPELKGCHSQGDSLEEAMKNIREAVEVYLGTLTPTETKRLRKKEVFTTSMHVHVA